MEVILLTESDGFFGQVLMPWETMDVSRIVDRLSAVFSVTRATYAEIASGKMQPRNAFIITGSSQQPQYKAYVDDILLYLHSLGNTLVPSIHCVRSHENKGYQELHKRLCGVLSPQAMYMAKPSELPSENFKHPLVFKEIEGFGSSGVRLIRDAAELRQATRSAVKFTVAEIPRRIRTYAANLFRAHILRRSKVQASVDYYRPLKRFVLQHFIPNLGHDYKVIAFQNRVFVLKRLVRTGDFRASGSGKFSFDEPPRELLDVARSILLQFDEPYLSLDICFDGRSFHLIEFQGVHFGPYTVINAPMHFEWVDNTWILRTGVVRLEDVVAESLILHIQKHLALKSHTPG